MADGNVFTGAKLKVEVKMCLQVYTLHGSLFHGIWGNMCLSSTTQLDNATTSIFLLSYI